MTDQQERALRSLDSASALVRKQLGGKPGAAAEKIYGQAYTACVVLGLKPQLRRRYR